MAKKIAIILFITGVVIFFWYGGADLFKTKTTTSETTGEPKVEAYNPPFKKEGELELIDGKTNEVTQKLSIEIADNDTEASQGMMYRSSMQDNQGMLFIFDTPMDHTFWMKNTKIYLDIIFIDQQFRVTHIHRNARPYSEEAIPSNGPILYVLEVNGGFSDKNGIEIGDKISFQRG